MIIYSDTSALAKRYLTEVGSELVSEILQEEQSIFISAMTQLELISAIEMAKRSRRINSPDYRTAFANFESDLRKTNLSLIDISPEIIKRAVSLIRIRRLRAPDAIQLATALALSKQINGDLHFLCADHALLDAARSEGLRCKDASK